MSFVITQNFSLVGRQAYLKCCVQVKALARGLGQGKIIVREPVTITKQIGPATYEAKVCDPYGVLTITLKRDDFILPPAPQQEPVWGDDDFEGFVYGPNSGFYNPFRKII